MNSKKYLVRNEIINKDIISFIQGNENNIDSINIIEQDEIYSLKETDEIHIFCKFFKDLSGNYSFLDNSISNYFLSKKNIYFIFIDNNTHLTVSDIRLFLSDEKHDHVTDNNEFNKIINKCELTQKSFIENFDKRIMHLNEFANFYKFFISLKHSGSNNPNYDFYNLEKLDQISQSINSIHSMPFLLRNHSVTYRLLMPLKSFKENQKKDFAFNR